MQLGRTDAPGGAAALRRSAPFRFRYEYLAGGVNPGEGWATWNENGSFVTRYVAESRRVGEIPVFTYYMLLQSKPGGGDEAQANLANLRSAATMRSYWADLTLFFQRARGSSTVVLHVEPDLWGYVQQAARGDDASTVTAVVPEGPQTVAGFAQHVVHLRDTYAPNAHLRAYASAGFVAFLFGGGADGTTCACDARRDGATNPAPINGNTRRSLSADDDGGYFRARAHAYYRAGALRLP